MCWVNRFAVGSGVGLIAALWAAGVGGVFSGPGPLCWPDFPWPDVDVSEGFACALLPLELAIALTSA